MNLWVKWRRGRNPGARDSVPTRTSAEVARAEPRQSGFSACRDLCGGGTGVRTAPAGTGLGEYASDVGCPPGQPHRVGLELRGRDDRRRTVF